MVEAE